MRQEPDTQSPPQLLTTNYFKKRAVGTISQANYHGVRKLNFISEIMISWITGKVHTSSGGWPLM